MPKRNSPKDFQELADLNRLSEIVIDKRNEKRADAKKGRRNRHYERLFIRQAIKDFDHSSIQKEDLNETSF